MTSSNLFEEGIRESTDPKRIGETVYQFLDRSARPGMSTIRSTLNSWFLLLPDDLKGVYLSRFKAKRNFEGAFYELFLLGLFKKMGFRVTLDPITGKNSKVPDFLLCKEQEKIYVEATRNEYSSTSKVPRFKIREQIIEELNNLDLGDLRLLINELRVFVDQKPSIKELKLQLNDHCKKINLLGYADNSFVISDDDLFPYQDENIFISASFYVKRNYKAQSKKTVVGDSYDIGADETACQLKNSIEAKKSKYGKLQKPYIICVNFPRMMLDKNEILSVYEPLQRKGKEINGKLPRSLFSESPSNNSISALIVSFVLPFNMSNPQFWILKNPNADFPIDSNQFCFDTYEYKEGTLVFTPAQISFSELIGISESL